jgi:hypothetical protein
LDAEPPAIFCTRRVSSSFLSSTSCFDKSFLDLSTKSEVHRCGRGSIALGLELVGLDFSGHRDGVWQKSWKAIWETTGNNLP